jgi:hypothetical protein
LGRCLNGNTVLIFDKIQILNGIFIFGFAVIVIIEFDFRNIELNQTPQKPVDIRKRLEEID